MPTFILLTYQNHISFTVKTYHMMTLKFKICSHWDITTVFLTNNPGFSLIFSMKDASTHAKQFLRVDVHLAIKLVFSMPVILVHCVASVFCH